MYWASPVASFSAGLIAYGVQKHMVLVDGLQSWKWLFIVEGIPSIALGIIITLMLPSLPDRVAKTGHFLFRSKSEKELMVQRSIAGMSCARTLTPATLRRFNLRPLTVSCPSLTSSSRPERS